MIQKKPDKKLGTVFEYDTTLESYVLKVLDPEVIFPCFIKDPDAGIYKIIKTRNGGLHMSK